MTFQQIADKLAISTATVRLCISKFQKGGLDAALFDVQRPGRPSEITDDAKAWMIHIACQRPTELGYAQELWTLTSLHKYIQKHAEEAGYPRLSTVTKPYIQKFLKEQDMKPFKIKYYCEKRDPDFESKMHEVLLVYKQIEMQFDENGDLIVPDDYKLTTMCADVGNCIHSGHLLNGFYISRKICCLFCKEPNKHSGCIPDEKYIFL